VIGRNASAPPDDLDAEGIDALAEALVAGTEPIELLWIRDEYELAIDCCRRCAHRPHFFWPRPWRCYPCAHAVATRLWPRLLAEHRAQAEEDAAQAAEDRWT
jgi:hypothetical protein